MDYEWSREMAEVKVNPGICGLETTITVTSEMDTASIVISSQCPSVQKMQDELMDIDCLEECFSKFGTSRVYKAAEKHCKHVGCPVPAAIIKGLEVACGYALPKDVAFKISK
jgi:hypothetical protein